MLFHPLPGGELVIAALDIQTIKITADATHLPEQDVFVAVYKHIEGFKGDSKFSTWLFRIANNVASNTRTVSRNCGDVWE